MLAFASLILAPHIKAEDLKVFVMLPSVWAPSPEYKETKGVTADYVLRSPMERSAAASGSALVDGCKHSREVADIFTFKSPLSTRSSGPSLLTQSSHCG